MSMDELLAGLKKTYLSELPEKWNEMEDQFNSQSWEELRNSYHKLKGSGKTYGIPEISELFKELERICAKSPESIVEVFRDGQDLVKEIKEANEAGSSLNLSEDPRFKKIVSTGA